MSSSGHSDRRRRQAIEERTAKLLTAKNALFEKLSRDKGHSFAWCHTRVSLGPGRDYNKQWEGCTVCRYRLAEGFRATFESEPIPSCTHSLVIPTGPARKEWRDVYDDAARRLVAEFLNTTVDELNEFYRMPTKEEHAAKHRLPVVEGRGMYMCKDK